MADAHVDGVAVEMVKVTNFDRSSDRGRPRPGAPGGSAPRRLVDLVEQAEITLSVASTNRPNTSRPSETKKPSASPKFRMSTRRASLTTSPWTGDAAVRPRSPAAFRPRFRRPDGRTGAVGAGADEVAEQARPERCRQPV